MAASNAKGIVIYMSKAKAAGTAVPITNLTTAGGTLEVTAATGKADPGDLVRFNTVGYPGVDGKIFTVKAEATGVYTFDQGTKISPTFGTLDSGAEFTVYKPGVELVNLCLSNIEFKSEAADSIPVGTYCDPSATIPGVSGSAGTVTATGYVDIKGKDYQELLTAAQDGAERVIQVVLPNNGSLVAPIAISDIIFETPLDGAIGYTITGTLGSKLRHVF